LAKDDIIRILTAVDGSEQSGNAVRYAGGIMAPGRVKMDLAHILNVIPEVFFDVETFPVSSARMSSMHSWVLGQRKKMEKSLEKAVAGLVEQGYPREDVTATIMDRKWGIARDILFTAGQGYDALVVGRTGASKIKGIFLGSIAFKLIGKLSGVSLWLVGGKPDTKNILIAVDGSEGAMRAVDYVGKMAASIQGSVTLLHVQRDPRRSGPQDASVSPLTDEIERIGSQVDAFLQDAKRRLASAGIPEKRVSERVVKEAASRAAMIVDHAAKGGFGTIVVGRRGLSRVQEFFMGRVSQKIVQLAKDMAVWVVE